MDVKFPEITVQLTGRDSNAFFILARTRKALKRAGVSDEVIAEYVKEATSGDYDNLLCTTMRWVSVQ